MTDLEKARRTADEVESETLQPDPEDAGDVVDDALRPPDFRTKTSAPSTSERRLRSEELPEATDSTQG